MRALIAVLAFAAALIAGPAGAAPSAGEHEPAQPAGVTLDMVWTKARARFIAAGYRPVPIRGRPADDSTCVYMSEACEQYPETFGCRLTGLGGCLYLFRRPGDRRLVLIGTWGDKPERFTGLRWLKSGELKGFRL